MIIAGRKNVGKRLTRHIVDSIRKDGYCEVAALSDLGAKRVNKAAQDAANVLKCRLVANPRSDEITLDGASRIALVVNITFDT